MILIRPARIIDSKIVLSFMNELESVNFEEKPFKKNYLKNLRSKNIIYRIAWFKEVPIGFISCHIQTLLHHNAEVAEIQEMFVVKAHRNKGVGGKMLKLLMSILSNRKINQLEVVSNRKRKQTHKFYLDQHFRWTSKKFVLKF